MQCDGQWPPVWSDGHSGSQIIVPRCSLNILNITPNCIIKVLIKADFRMLGLFYILLWKSLVKGVCYFLLHIECYYYEYKRAFLHLCFLKFPKKYKVIVKIWNTLKYIHLLDAYPAWQQYSDFFSQISTPPHGSPSALGWPCLFRDSQDNDSEMEM